MTPILAPVLAESVRKMSTASYSSRQEFRMRVTILFGMYTFIRYEYWIDGHYWIDVNNVHSVRHGLEKEFTSLSTPISKWGKYYNPLVME